MLLADISSMPVIEKILSYPHLQELVREYDLVLRYLRYAPDIVISLFNVKEFKSVTYSSEPEEDEEVPTMYPYDYLYQANRPDLIRKLYSRDELRPTVQLYLAIIDYITGDESISSEIVRLGSSVCGLTQFRVERQCYQYLRQHQIEYGHKMPDIERLMNLHLHTAEILPPNWYSSDDSRDSDKSSHEESDSSNEDRSFDADDNPS